MKTLGIFTLTLFSAVHIYANLFIPAEASSIYGHKLNSERFNHVISGYAVQMPDSIPFEGLKILFTDVGETVVDEDGFYSMEVPRHWSGTATPYLCDGGGYIFEPPFIGYENVVFDQPNQNYSGEAVTTYTISGSFTDKFSGEPLANTEIRLYVTGDEKSDFITVTTNELGEYSIERLPCWSSTLDPSLTGFYYFEPMTISFDPLISDLPEQNFEVICYEYALPEGWETINTGTFAFISVDILSDPDICGTPIEIGDLIGVFYTGANGSLKCGGYCRWQDESNGFINAQGDDNTTQAKDGFASNEPYTWKIYSYDQQQEFPAEVEMSSGENKWTNFGLSKVGSLDGFLVNNIQVFKGWSGLSSFTMPGVFPPLITTIMNPIIDDLVILQSLDKMYYPAGGVNNLLVWSYLKGYKIKVNNDVELPMNGCPEENRTINLASGWNIIPVLSNCNVIAEDFFDPIINKLSLVKEIGGTGIYWPDMQVNTLQVLKPGRAYLVAVSEQASLTYLPCDSPTGKQAVQKTTEANLTQWKTPVVTGSTHSVVFKSEALRTVEEGDFIGAFTNSGLCAGLVQVNDKSGNVALTLFGDDMMTPEIDGFLNDSEIIFKICNPFSNNEIIANAEYDPGFSAGTDRFTENGLSVITDLTILSSVTNDNKDYPFFYPNPGSGIIKISAADEDLINLSVHNAEGRLMIKREISGNQNLDLSHLPKGVYLIKIESQHHCLTDKLILN